MEKIHQHRLYNQFITNVNEKGIIDIVNQLGAIQAQDLAMSRWAIGLRMSAPNDTQLERAITEGQILRTHVLRPTWHWVAAENIHWMLALSAPNIIPQLRARQNELGLNSSNIAQSLDYLPSVLDNGLHLTRDEIAAAFEKKELPHNSSQMYHIMMEAELKGIVASGKVIGNESTYALLEGRAPKNLFSKEESLAKLAQLYFKSHGWATVHDFAWWSGLTMKDARQALEMIHPQTIKLEIEKQTYYAFEASIELPIDDNNVFLLPAFDEYYISYKDRTACLSAEHHAKVISSNGIFRPIVVVDGKVVGLWKRINKTANVQIEIDLFEPQNHEILSKIEQKAKDFATFVGKKLIYKLTK